MLVGLHQSSILCLAVGLHSSPQRLPREREVRGITGEKRENFSTSLFGISTGCSASSHALSSLFIYFSSHTNKNRPTGKRRA